LLPSGVDVVADFDDDRRGLGRQRGAAIGSLVLLIALVGLMAYAAGGRSSEYSAYDAFRDAVRAVDAAGSAAAAGDQAAVERQMDELARLLGVGRARLAGVEAGSSAGSAARAMLEAANCLEFMVRDFRATRRVDFSLTQCASRELNRAVSGAAARSAELLMP
jgi:hypothetical protein